jgi:uncharacterized lipoprotein
MAAVLCACSSQPEYFDAKTLPPLVTPDGIDSQRLGQLYPVPEQTGRVPTKSLIPFPPTVGVQDNANIASLQTMDDQLWVLNAKSPATTWSQLLSFFQGRKIAIARQDLSTATIETDWFEQAVQPGVAIRYRLRLDQGMQSDTTDIFFRNEKRIGTEAVANISLEHLQDRAHANWLANELIVALNNPNAAVGDSYLATTIDLPQKVKLTDVNDEPVLVTIADQPRLIRALNKALDENGLLLYGSDIESGVYHVDQYTPRDKKSRWGRFFSWGSDRPDSKPRYTIGEIINHLPNNSSVNTLFPDVSKRETDKKLSSIPGYLLIIRPLQGQTIIYLRDGYGNELAGDKARAILDTIRLRLL